MNEFVAIVVATIAAGTPLVFAALGELVVERSGVLNLGIEVMMLAGALAGFAATAATNNPWIGAGAGMAAGAALALLFALLTISLMANQVASGLALSIFGGGLTAFLGKPYESVSLSAPAAVHVPGLSALPVLGPILFAEQPLVYLSWSLFALVCWFLYRSRAGLVVRAVGESPTSAYAIGYHVTLIRYLATLFGGAMAGLGGAYLSTVYTPSWAQDMTAGRGWIALALVVFATWKPERALLGAYLFGGVTIVQFFAQGAGLSVPTQLLTALPYLATIVVLVLISRDATTIRLNAPASLGLAFHADA
ncbi:MAG TPA: ABC transporter permease [Candidatus Acidoferrales bacterium]|nr:ABC transporter permease [Candidatus Acidoferrales bacterium]